jgi:hypothetical protein
MMPTGRDIASGADGLASRLARILLSIHRRNTILLIVIRDNEVHRPGESCEQFPDSGTVILQRTEVGGLSRLDEDICGECFPNLTE